MLTRRRWLPVFSLLVAVVLGIAHEAPACGSGGGLGEAATAPLGNMGFSEMTPYISSSGNVVWRDKGEVKIERLRKEALAARRAESESIQAERGVLRETEIGVRTADVGAGLIAIGVGTYFTFMGVPHAAEYTEFYIHHTSISIVDLLEEIGGDH